MSKVHCEISPSEIFLEQHFYHTVCNSDSCLIKAIKLHRIPTSLMPSNVDIKGAVSRHPLHFVKILPITRPQSLWNLM